MFSNVMKTINKGINKFIKNQNKYTIKGKDYYEDRLLAEGGYGYVYVVEDPESGIKYALKKMNIQDNEQVINIKREIELWKRVNNHTNVVKLYDYEITQTFVLILMEFCMEGTLLDLINNRQEIIINENQALYIIKEVATGIHHMHTQNPPIAHRDIKIENVLKVGNNFKICDFGSSTIETLDPRKVSKNVVLDNFSRFEKMTTFMYRPPEMCDPYSKFPIYEKVDVWMLGCILYALLFKQHPFQDAQKLTIINAHYYIPESATNYSDNIIDLIRLMLTPNPLNRPSAKDIISLIVNWGTLGRIELPEETLEIKSKQLRNVKSNKNDLLTNDDISRIQKEIMKEQAKKNKFKRKLDDDTDINEMFDDIELHDNSSTVKKRNTSNHNENFENDFFNSGSNAKNNNVIKNSNFINQNNNNSKPFQGFESMNTNQNINNTNTKSEWMIDFNQGLGNSNSNNNVTNSNKQFENNFGFDFLDDNSGSNNNVTSTNKYNNSNNFAEGFQNLDNVFSNSNQNSKNSQNTQNKNNQQVNPPNNLLVNDNNLHSRSKSSNTHLTQNNQKNNVQNSYSNNSGFNFDDKFSNNHNISSNSNNNNIRAQNFGQTPNFGVPINNQNMNNINQQRQTNQNNNTNNTINNKTQNKVGDQNIFDFFK